MKNSHCRDRKMEAYCDEVRRLEDKFYGLELNHVARRYNETTDELAKIASGRTTVPRTSSPGTYINHPSNSKTRPNLRRPRPSPRNPRPPRVRPCALRENRAELRQTKTGRPRTWNISSEESCPLTRPKLGDWLGAPSRSFCWVMKKSYTTKAPRASSNDAYPLPKDKSCYKKYTWGACGHHAAPRALVGNAFRQGFYWPTAVANATRIVRSCRGCQFYARQTHLPAQALQTIPITWSFAVWGLDLVGPLQKAPGGFTHLLVAIDKFSKWIEVRPLTSIGFEQAVAFFTNIIHRFGVPNSIITDNGTQFTGKKFLDFCEDHHIHVDWAAIAHPMTNGQVERTNGMILQGLKPRIYNDLNKFGKRWIKELPSVVWSLRTTPSQATGFSPFS
jgi:transposase InsO family protein